MATTEGDTAKVPLEVSYIIAIIINTITCPFVVLLIVQVIMAVKTRPRLRTNSNILLACLGVTDALTGLLGRPSYIPWRMFQLLVHNTSETAENFISISYLYFGQLHAFIYNWLLLRSLLGSNLRRAT